MHRATPGGTGGVTTVGNYDKSVPFILLLYEMPFFLFVHC